MGRCHFTFGDTTTENSAHQPPPGPEEQSVNPSTTAIEDNQIPPVETEPRFNNHESPVNSLQNNEKIVKESKGLLSDHRSEEFTKEPVPCTCGVFLSGQFKRGSKEQPKGVPVLTQETDTPFLNNAVGSRQCTNKCLEVVRIFSCSFD